MAGEETVNGNGHDVNRNYAVTAQLGERVTNLGWRQTDMELGMRSRFNQMENNMAGIAMRCDPPINPSLRAQHALVAGHRRGEYFPHHPRRVGILAYPVFDDGYQGGCITLGGQDSRA